MSPIKLLVPVAGLAAVAIVAAKLHDPAPPPPPPTTIEIATPRPSPTHPDRRPEPGPPA